MSLIFEDRPSDSPHIERVWRCQTDTGGPFLSIAAGHVELVVTRLPDLTMVTLRGPETRATTIDAPPGGQWVAVRFALGVHLPRIPTPLLVDRRDLNLPVAADGSFRLAGHQWELPDFDNAEEFVARLTRRGVIDHDRTVNAVLHGDRQVLTQRSVECHFRRTTGMTQGMFRQIERARHATNLLAAGTPILDVVHQAGYFDQAHLSRSLKAMIGQSPMAIRRREKQLSFLYKTNPGRRR